MSSSQPAEGTEISSGALVASEIDSAAKSQKQVRVGMRRRRAQLSPFTVPDNSSIFLLGANERRERKEEMRKFLALPIEEKTAHATRMTAKLKVVVGELEEENERKRKTKQIKSSMVLPKPTSGRHELKMAFMKDDTAEESKHNLIFMERQQAVLQLSLMTKRAEITRMDKVLAKEEKKLQQLEKIIESDNHKFEEFLRENERKSVEARTLFVAPETSRNYFLEEVQASRTLTREVTTEWVDVYALYCCFEREDKSKQEKTAAIRKLTAEIGAIKSEIVKFDEVLTDYKRYQEFLFKISPPEWQEEQKRKAVKAKFLPDEGGHDDQSKEPLTLGKGLESKLSRSGGELPSIRESRLASAHSDTVGTDSTVKDDSSEFVEEPELYFTDPQQQLDLMTELTEQNLSLIQNSARVEEALEKLKQAVEKTRRKIEQDDEQIVQQIDYMNQKIVKEKKRGAKLQQKIQLHVSVSTEDQDVMLDALSAKVAEVHRSVLDDRMTNHSTLEKVANIENRLISLLQGLESIPEEKLALTTKIKDSEKRTRQREEKLVEQREKQKERMRRYMERSLADSKKISGRKLMPRCMPVARKSRVVTVDNSPAEDEINEYFFGSDDTE